MQQRRHNQEILYGKAYLVLRVDGIEGEDGSLKAHIASTIKHCVYQCRYWMEKHISLIDGNQNYNPPLSESMPLAQMEMVEGTYVLPDDKVAKGIHESAYYHSPELKTLKFIGFKHSLFFRAKESQNDVQEFLNEMTPKN